MASTTPSAAITGPVHDPVNRISYAFEPAGEDLIVHSWLEPGGALPAHRHPRQTETWEVIEGRVVFRLDRDERLLGPEDGELVVPPDATHALSSHGGGHARLRCRVEPAGDLQAFIEDSAAAARAGLFMRDGIPRGLRGVRWAARFLKRHRGETVFASPPPVVQGTLIALFARGS